MRIDLNCDLGESFGAYNKGEDEQMMPYITSANMACGFHAGDPSVMRRTVQLVLAHGVQAGAHPGFPDLVGFGRRDLAASPEEIQDMVVYQIGAIHAFVAAEGGTLKHVKPHGALYNMAAKRADIADAIAQAVYEVNPQLVLFGLSGSQLIAAGKRMGLQTASEVFADRTYQPDGSLTPRTLPNALITEVERSVRQVVTMVREGFVVAVDGTRVQIEAETVCLHGDGAHAVEFAAALYSTLQQEGIAMCPVSYEGGELR